MGVKDWYVNGYYQEFFVCEVDYVSSCDGLVENNFVIEKFCVVEKWIV